MSAAGLHLSAAHPLARIAARHCAGHQAPLMGGVACGACWERAIRDDERVVVEFELDRELLAEPSDLIDAIAVERACAGESLPLTEAEVSAAIQRLRRAGWSKPAISDQLGIAEQTVNQEAAPLPRRDLTVMRKHKGVAA